MTVSLEGKTALITGAKGGLGSFVTNAFLDAGAAVVGVSRSIQASDFPHPRFSAISTSLSTGDAAREVVKRCGRIDILVHIIGAFAGGHSVAETEDAVIDHMTETNYRSAFFVVRAVLPL